MLCQQCRRQPILPAVRATVFASCDLVHHFTLDYIEGLAAFCVVQWIQLEWPMPDVIIPMPDPNSIALGRAIADLLQRPFARVWSFGTYRDELLEEGGKWLLIDFSNPTPMLQKATSELMSSFPKRIYLLTLFPYAFGIS